MSNKTEPLELEGCLIGVDGNAFALMAYFTRQARRQGVDEETIDAVIEEAQQSDYRNLVSTLNRHFADPAIRPRIKGLLTRSKNIMTALLNNLKLETGYDYQIKDGYRKKTGNFFFEQGYDLINVAFQSDQNGNVESLTVIEALKDGEEPMDFIITPEVYKQMQLQIEPHLWNEEPQEERDSMRSLGFTNSDFLYG